MPATHTLFGECICDRNAFRSDGGYRRRPHALKHNLATDHQVHRLAERFPESAEMVFLLFLYQEVHQEIDFGLGHVTLIFKFEQAHGLKTHSCVHHANLRNVQQSDLAFKIRAKQFCPGIDCAARFLGIVSNGIGVVPPWHHGDVLGWSLNVIAVFIHPKMPKRSIALANFRIWRKFAGL